MASIKAFKVNLSAAIERLESGEALAGRDLANLVAAITGFEVEEGGPYALPDGKVDYGFNLLIAYFLLLCEVKLPKLESYFADTTPGSTFLTDWEMESVSRRWREARERAAAKENQSPNDPGEEEMLGNIQQEAEKRFAGLSPELREHCRAAVQKTMRANRDKQMSLISFYLKGALGEKGEVIPDSTVARLGLSNIFFWTAFIIYDDFWDEDEAADPKILPVANLFARSYIEYFSTLLPEQTSFRAFFRKLMDSLDTANNWETIHCRAKIENGKFIIPDVLPDYGDYEFKFRPASGHILGPVAMLMRLGYDLDSPEIKNLISYFKHYLIAMQINDDLHDWEEDLRRGHISTTVVELLRRWPKKEIDLVADLDELKKIYWFETIAPLAGAAVSHTEKSRQALRAVTCLSNPAPLARFIDITEGVAKKALREQADSVDFLEAYK